ncbi:MAG: YCF48-related protein [Blastocatellia bacterium]
MNLLKTICLSFVCLSALTGLLFLKVPVAGQTQTRSFAIQVASAISEDGASAAVEELKEKGVEAYMVKSEVPGKGIRYRVRVGKFPNQQSAKSTGEKLTANGTIQEFAVMAYELPSSAYIARREPKIKPTSQPDAENARAEKPLPVQSEDRPAAIKRVENHNPAEKANSPREAPAPSVESKTSAAKLKENKVESKPAIKPEPIKLTGAKPEPDLTRNIPAAKSELFEKPVSNPPASEMTASMEPKIATPPLADALTDASFTNSNWKLVRRSAETDKNLRALHFVDAMTGWAAGDAGAVYRTTDGGRTWKPLLSGVSANINFIHFLDWNHGWMIAESNRKDETDGETMLLTTINGGRTWMIQKIPNLLSVYFTDLQNGWAVGRNATLLRTTNGGNDWKPVEEVQSVVGLPIESSNYNFGFRDVYFLDANHGWLIGNFYGRAQSNIGGLFVTADGGKTWKRVPLTLKTQHVSGRFTPGLLHSVQFTDLNTGSVTGEMTDGESRYFFALHTRDGGKNWEQYRTPSRATHSTQFLDPTNGWMAAFAQREGSAEAVVYDSTLMRTDNGGMSWQNDFTAKGSRVRSVFFLSPNKGWAVGDRGMILRYEDKSKAMN